MMRLIFAAMSGALFGAGLLISGMTDPARVQGWLDIFGDWDPTLGFVMAGAILPMAVAWRIAARRAVSFTGRALPTPPNPVIDRNLVTGAVLFGLGWGIAGLCPGPAMASLGFGGLPFAVFFLSMAAGMILFGLWNRR
ncbi:DUF6691 family protein [Paracoccus homiensis]|uniref:Sulphur transport domain-containing protein n=1 Tax=Paracoccus homiensis TaxID=364199 RepID=A0A1I0IW46_9RHOB|nr:DUF6691 family protein [Paracoccus homiensis]SEU01507.1 hypothetical protein SAMN04489858_11950 [Paracoccus homiensis]